MGKALIIAEKPSVANDIARALGGFTRHGDYFESDEYVISSAIGHLVEIAVPDEFEVMLANMDKLRADAGRSDEPFEVIVALASMPDKDLYARFEELGVSGVMCAPWLTRSPAKDRYGYDSNHVRTRMEAFAESFIG